MIKKLNLATERATSGPLHRKYVLVWDEETQARVAGLCADFGVEYVFDQVKAVA